MMTPMTKMGLTYYPASSWGMTGRLGPVMKPARPRFVVHHAQAPNVACGVGLEAEVRAMKQMEDHQVASFGRFSYQWAVFQSGNVYEGQGWGRVGAHVANNNSACYGCCLVIDGGRVLPTDAAVQAVRRVIAAGLQGGFLAADFQVVGHRDVLPGYECPGALLYPRLGELFGAKHAGPRPVLRFGDEGPHVVDLQRLLAMPEQYRTGLFSTITQAAVEQFQARHQMPVDGIVGPKTWAQLEHPG